jgi:ATP-binding cassette subfamily F protein 3
MAGSLILTVPYLRRHGEEEARGKLGAYLFCGDDVFKKVSQLSGGQQSRLMLCKLVLSEADVLVLDEPTNHLDIDSREVLEQALLEYPGAIIMVSHDRFLLDRAAGRLLVVGADDCGRREVGNFRFVSSDKKVYTRYAELVEINYAREQQESSAGGGAGRRKRARPEGSKPKTRLPKELRQFNKYTTEQIEKMIIEAEENLSGMKEKFGEAVMYQQPELLAEHRAAYDDAQAHLELLYRAYELRDI